MEYGVLVYLNHKCMHHICDMLAIMCTYVHTHTHIHTHTHTHSLCPMTDCFQIKLQLTWFWVCVFSVWGWGMWADLQEAPPAACSQFLPHQRRPIQMLPPWVSAHIRDFWSAAQASEGTPRWVEEWLEWCRRSHIMYTCVFFGFFFLCAGHTHACMYTHSQSKQKTHQNWKMSPKSAWACFTVNLQLFGGQFEYLLLILY